MPDTIKIFYSDGWVAVDTAYPTLSGIATTREKAMRELVTAYRVALQGESSALATALGEAERLRTDNARLERELAALLRFGVGVSGVAD